MTKNLTVKVSKRYQIAMPAQARRRLNIESGDRLIVDIQGGVIVLIPESKSYTEAMVGLHKAIWHGTETQKHIDEERDVWVDSAKG